MSINLHGTITEDNLSDRCAETAKYKPHRLILLNDLVKVLDKLSLTYSLDGGTLLGAWRSGTMLAWDDDVDLVLFTDDVQHESSLEEKRDFLEKTAARLRSALGEKTKVRCVTSYATKLEVYREEFGKYPFRDTDYHNVCCDLTLLLPYRNNTHALKYQHSCTPHIENALENFLPLSSIKYEGNYYNAPHATQAYLKEHYGYLGDNAVFDAKTGFYVEKKMCKSNVK